MRLTSLLAAAIVAAAVLYWFVLRHEMAPQEAAGVVVEPVTQTAQAPAPVRPVAVQVLETRAKETRGTLIVRGRTEANRLVRVAAETTGRVLSEPLRRGSVVSEGDLLCRLDPGTRAAELAQAEAALAQAEAEATAASELSTKGFTAETTLKTRLAALQAAQARLDAVRWDIRQLEIRAPFDGVLESDAAELGSYLRLGDPCATVIDLSKVKVSGYVSEQEVDLLATGQPARARLVNGVEAEGVITFLSRMADTDTRTYAVEVTLENPDTRMRDGMTAELLIDLPPVRAHLIPQSALTLDDRGRMGVRLDVDGVARFVEVRPLDDATGGIWVTGLPDAARIIVVGQEFVRDGRAVVGTPVETLE